MHRAVIRKTCSKCKKSYPATDRYFYQDYTRNDGLHSRCKVCEQAYQKEYRIKRGLKARKENPTNQPQISNACQPMGYAPYHGE